MHECKRITSHHLYRRELLLSGVDLLQRYFNMFFFFYFNNSASSRSMLSIIAVTENVPRRYLNAAGNWPNKGNKNQLSRHPYSIQGQYVIVIKYSFVSERWLSAVPIQCCVAVMLLIVVGCNNKPCQSQDLLKLKWFILSTYKCSLSLLTVLSQTSNRCVFLAKLNSD